MYTCGLCTKKAPCNTAEMKNLPNNCPCHDVKTAELSKSKYVGEDKRISDAGAITEYEGYCKRTRIEEIMEFATDRKSVV